VDIKQTAPAVTHEQVRIAADVQTVWQVLSDIGRWPVWNKAVHSVSVHGPLRAGTTFDWKAGPGVIKSRLAEVQEPQRIAWTGKTMGIRAVDVFRIEAAEGGGTLVYEDESWEGLVVRLFRGPLRRNLQGGIRAGLQALKAEAERRAYAERAA
jgi:hypothetical protein